MSELFVIRNQLGHYWGKSKAWVDGSDARAVMRARHQDQAVNTLFELSSKDIELRGEVLEVETTERGEPVIEPSQIALPIDEDLSAESDDEDTATQNPEVPAAVAAAGEEPGTPGNL